MVGRFGLYNGSANHEGRTMDQDAKDANPEDISSDNDRNVHREVYGRLGSYNEECVAKPGNIAKGLMHILHPPKGFPRPEYIVLIQATCESIPGLYIWKDR